MAKARRQKGISTGAGGQAGSSSATNQGRHNERVGGQQRPRKAAVRGQRESFFRWGAVAAVGLIAIGVIALVALGRQAGDGLPGPEGGPSVAQDVGSLVGQAAPAFTLEDADGNSYAVTPGQGKPLVLVTHMGIT